MTLKNDFHNTAIEVKAQLGDIVLDATQRRWAKKLCGVATCQCSGPGGVRGGEFRLAAIGNNKFEIVAR